MISVMSMPNGSERRTRPYWASFDKARCRSDVCHCARWKRSPLLGAEPDVREREVQSWRHDGWRGISGRWSKPPDGIPFLTLALSALAAVSAHAQMLAPSMTTASDFGARKIFLMLFLMIGPIKILVPFVDITRGADAAFRRTLARRAILFSAAALALAGVLGRSMLENFEISLPVLALTGGVVLFLVALRTVLQQSAGTPASARSARSAARPEICLRAARVPDDRHALRDRRRDCLCNPCCRPGGRRVHGGRHRVAYIGSGLGGDAVCRDDPPTIGPALQVFAVVLGVTQIALGLQIILHSLCMIGVLAGCRS